MTDLMKFAWSHSSIEVFRQCPRRYFEVKIAKTVKDEFKGKAADWGNLVHKAMERRVRFGSPLPADMKQWEKVAAALADAKGTILTEQQLALTMDRKPTEWFAQNVRSRSIIDYLNIHPSGKKAMVVDYKTGKKKEEDRQLALCAAFVFDHYPDVDTVVSGYLWLGAGGFTKATFIRKYTDRLWGLYLPVVAQVEASIQSGQWPEKPSGLCYGYCPVKPCEFWNPRRSK